MSIVKNLARLLFRVRASSNTILQYDSTTGNLTIWFWPVNEEGERVVPSELHKHRRTHDFRLPSCICPILRHQDDYVEAEIILCTNGRFFGEYIAVCSKKQCGYLALVERVHSRRGLPLRYYPFRDIDQDPVDQAAAMVVDNFEAAPDIDMAGIQQWAPPERNSRSVFDCLLRLDCIINPGLTVAEFKGLFANCQRCGLVMTKRIFLTHQCRAVGNAGRIMEIIDLTQED